MARAFTIKQLDCIKCCRQVRARVPVDDSSPQLCPDCGTELMAIGTLHVVTEAEEGWREFPHQGGWLELPDGTRWRIAPGVLKIRPVQPDEKPPIARPSLTSGRHAAANSAGAAPATRLADDGKRAVYSSRFARNSGVCN